MAPANRPIKNVVVIGSTGNIGGPIIQALIAHPAQYNVTAVTRDRTKSSFTPSVKIAESDLSTDSLRTIFEGKDAVICSLPADKILDQKRIIDIAIESGVIRFLPSEYGMDSANPAAKEYLPIIAGKVQVVDYLRSKEDQISWSSTIVGSFFDWALSIPGLLGYNIPKRTVTVYDSGDVEFEATNVAKIGEAVAAMLSPEHQAETANQYIYVNSFTLTQNQVVKALEKVTGDKFQVKEATTAGLRSDALERAKTEGAAAVALDVIVAIMYGQGGINNYSRDVQDGLWNDRLGLKRETLEDTLREVLKKY